MKYRNITALRSPKNRAYESLEHLTLRLPASDIEALKAYAKDNDTTANEVIRCLISKHLKNAKPRQT